MDWFCVYGIAPGDTSGHITSVLVKADWLTDAEEQAQKAGWRLSYATFRATAMQLATLEILGKL